jgi:hypothetical protein
MPCEQTPTIKNALTYDRLFIIVQVKVMNKGMTGAT